MLYSLLTLKICSLNRGLFAERQQEKEAEGGKGLKCARCQFISSIRSSARVSFAEWLSVWALGSCA